MYSRFRIQTRLSAAEAEVTLARLVGSLSALFFPLFATVVMSIGYVPERRRAMRVLQDAFRAGEVLPG